MWWVGWSSCGQERNTGRTRSCAGAKNCCGNKEQKSNTRQLPTHRQQHLFFMPSRGRDRPLMPRDATPQGAPRHVDHAHVSPWLRRQCQRQSSSSPGADAGRAGDCPHQKKCSSRAGTRPPANARSDASQHNTHTMHECSSNGCQSLSTFHVYAVAHLAARDEAARNTSARPECATAKRSQTLQNQNLLSKVTLTTLRACCSSSAHAHVLVQPNNSSNSRHASSGSTPASCSRRHRRPPGDRRRHRRRQPQAPRRRS